MSCPIIINCIYFDTIWQFSYISVVLFSENWSCSLCKHSEFHNSLGKREENLNLMLIFPNKTKNLDRKFLVLVPIGSEIAIGRDEQNVIRIKTILSVHSNPYWTDNDEQICYGLNVKYHSLVMCFELQFPLTNNAWKVVSSVIRYFRGDKDIVRLRVGRS